MSLVLDASVVVKRFVDEERSAAARALADAPHDFTAPEILLGEVLNAAWRKLRRGDHGRLAVLNRRRGFAGTLFRVLAFRTGPRAPQGKA